MSKLPLGKGLGALIGNRVANPEPAADKGESVQNVSIGMIAPSALQPRVEFPAEQLAELVESIRERGIIQPLIVRQSPGGYELIAGERRWRAAKEVGLQDVPVIVRQASDQDVLELALIENLQREGLNPIEEAVAYEKLSKDFSLTQEEISKKVGKNRATVANAMRLLDLSEKSKSLLKHGRISVGHAKVLLSLKGHEEQDLLAEKIVKDALTVRAAETVASKLHEEAGRVRKVRPGAGPSELPPSLRAVQNMLTHRLATRVVFHHGDKKGNFQIEYYGDEDLNRILAAMGFVGSPAGTAG
ncbi:MAG: ParB/RepB/Spo0J family partition protein [Terrimicrobiaceae bacterium]